MAVVWPHTSTVWRFFGGDHSGFVSGSVEPQLVDVARILFELAALDLLDDVDEPLIGRLNTDRLASRTISIDKI
jgi:hypothetical protein